MRRTPLLTVLVVAILASSSAFAADKKKKTEAEDEEIPMGETLDVDEDDFKEGGGEEAPTPQRIDEADKEEEDGGELDFGEDGKNEDDLQFTEDDEQQSVRPRAPARTPPSSTGTRRRSART